MIILDFLRQGVFGDIHEQRLRLGFHDESRTESLELRRVAFVFLCSFQRGLAQGRNAGYEFLALFLFFFFFVKKQYSFLVFPFCWSDLVSMV